MLRRDSLKTLALGGLGLGAAGLLGACSKGTTSFHSIDLTGADYAKDFALTDFNGQARSLADFKGKVVVMFFGYTQCPDVCPTTMLEMAQVKQQLGVNGDKLQVLFVSVDPERDTPDVLKAYVQAFDPSFLALYADTPDKLSALARDFKVYYKRVEGRQPGNYTMDHSAANYIYDPSGRLRLFSRYGSPIEEVAADIRKLLNGA